MLSLAGDIGPTEHHSKLPPLDILLYFLGDEEPELFIELGHELGSRRDTVILELLLILDISQILQLPLQLPIVLGALEPPGALVVHFGPWRHTVQPQKQEFLGLGHLDDGVYVIEDAEPDLFGLAGHHLIAEDD